MKRPIVTKGVPGAIGPYSQGIETNCAVYTSGQLPIDPRTGEMPAGIEAQAGQSLQNVRAVPEGAGLSMAHVVKTTVFLRDMGDFSKMNEVYAQFFSEPFPARSAVETARLPKDALVEIACVAAKE